MYDVKKYEESDKDRCRIKIRKSTPSPECRKRNIGRKDRKEKDRDKVFHSRHSEDGVDFNIFILSLSFS